jgi:hypothetical protein
VILNTYASQYDTPNVSGPVRNNPCSRNTSPTNCIRFPGNIAIFTLNLTNCSASSLLTSKNKHGKKNRKKSHANPNNRKNDIEDDRPKKADATRPFTKLETTSFPTKHSTDGTHKL